MSVPLQLSPTTPHVYEVRPRKDRRGVDLVSDALPFGGASNDEPRLVGIAHWAFAVWQNPFGMLSPEVVMNLLAEVRDCLGYSHNRSPFELPPIEIRISSICGT